MAKVTIEITAAGWQTSLQIGDKTYVEKHRQTPYGSSSKKDSQNFEELEDEIPDFLCDALSSLNEYEVMKALGNEEIED